MQTIKHLILAAVLFTAPSTAFAGAYHDLAREPHGIEVPVPEPAPAPAAPAAKKITIYTAKTIVTEDPGTPTAEAVAVMDGKILGVGTLDEVKDWVTDEQVEIDQRFKDAVIVPGLIEAHMHPQITGILWQGVYVGRFDRTAPDGTLVKGLDTKEAVVERLKDAAAKLPADGRWLVGWGYQPEFYGDSPLTRADLDPSFGGVKFVVDGSIQGYTGLFQWPGYYKTFANGIANISQDDLTKWVTEVHKRGFQAVIHQCR
jgi:predicted amidohydrolase YtcJ